jgi:hypothetical protein
MSVKICKHYVGGTCSKNPCEFTHINNICRHYFFGNCRNGSACSKSHQYQLKRKPQNQQNQQQHHKKRNTESFVPSHKPADMRVMIGNGFDKEYKYEYCTRDVILVSHLFDNMGDVYTLLLDEMKQCQSDDVWKLWHGDSHWIADDHLKWKTHCPTFTKVIERMKTYFRMDVKATRLNWYKDSSEWKPYHHDAAAIDEKKAKTQNLTIGVSFGATRDASFEHAVTKTTVNFPLSNGMTYGFGSQVNIEWRHGIPQLKVVHQEGRISIIAWGWADMSECI